MGSLLQDLSASAARFRHLQDIVELLKKGTSVAHLPLGPLFYTLKKHPPQVIREFLPLCSRRQRQAFLDLDLWRKDELDVAEFSFWLEVYGGSEREDLMLEFVTSRSFAAYLKGRFAISTFDVEDPEYPESNHYFLTEDQQLLIEHDANFQQVDEVKRLLRVLYSHWGVEKAYQYLMTLIVESFSNLEEQEYQEKKERLREFGVLDYYESLELLTPFFSEEKLLQFLRVRIAQTPELPSESSREVPAFDLIDPLSRQLSVVELESERIEDPKRREFLRFSFIRLIYAMVSHGHAFRDGPVSLKRMSLEIDQALQLGIDYLKEQFSGDVFALFDFLDVYRTGKTLLQLVPTEVKKTLQQCSLEDSSEIEEAWLGSVLEQFIQHTFLSRPHLLNWGETFEEELIVSAKQYRHWHQESRHLLAIAPLVKRLILARSRYPSASLEDLLLTALIKFAAKETDDVAHDLSVRKQVVCIVTKKWSEQLSAFKEDVMNFAQFFAPEAKDSLAYWLQLMGAHSLLGISFEELSDEEWAHASGLLVADS